MRRFLFALLLFAVDGIAMFLFQRYPAFFFPAYRDLSKRWIAFLCQIYSFCKVAVWDIAAVILAVSFIVSLVYVLIKRRSFLKYLSHVILAVSILVTLTVCGWMLNHYAPDLSEELDLDVKEYSSGELYEVCSYYFDKAADAALLIPRDKEGHAIRSDFYEMAAIAGRAYKNIEKKWPVFMGSDTPVKKLSVIGEYLMYNGIVGMYMPITGEAGVPSSVPEIPLGFTMAHEAGHRLGLAGEEEANFAAFLACIYNEDVRMIYSGYYNAFSYCFSALYSVDPEKALELYQSGISDGHILVKLDRKDTREAYDRYDSPLQEVSDQINDTYLKTFSEEEGIRSYGIVTDYLIAWYKNIGSVH